MKHSITFLAAAALVGATFAAKADTDIKPNPNPPPPKPSTSGSGQRTEEPGITDKGHDLSLSAQRGREPGMTYFVTYLKIGTGSSTRVL